MLWQKEVHTAAAGHAVSEGKLYLSREENELIVDVVEVESGLLDRSICLLGNTQNFKSPRVSGLICCGSRFLLGYDPYQGFFSAHDLIKNASICTLSMAVDGWAAGAQGKSNKNSPPSPVMRAICASRERDGMFFFSNWNEAHFYCVLLNASSGCVSTAVKVEGGFSKIENEKQKQEPFSLGTIVSMHTHPRKPYLFLSFSSGSVQVWNYLGLKRSLAKANNMTSNGELLHGGAAEDEEDEEDEEGEDDASDAGSDAGGSVKDGKSVGSRKSTTSSVLGSVFGNGRRKHKQAWQGMEPFALLAPPVLAGQDRTTTPQFTSTALSFDATGTLVAVVWQDSSRGVGTVAVYNARTATTRGPPEEVKGWLSSATKLAGPCVVTCLASFDPFYTTNWWIGPICFHAYEPLLFAAMLNEKESTHMLYALSLQDHSLRTVDAHEVQLDELDADIKMNYENRCAIPRQLQCTRDTGDLVLTLGGGRGDRNIILHMALARNWIADCGTLSKPLISYCAVPFESYLKDGDPLLQEQALTTKLAAQAAEPTIASVAASNNWLPVIVSVKPSLALSNASKREPEISLGLGGPLVLSLDVFRVHLGNVLCPVKKKTEDPVDAVNAAEVGDYPSLYIGSINACYTPANNRNSVKNGSVPQQWLHLSVDLHDDVDSDSSFLRVGGVFSPAAIIVNPSAKSDVSGKSGETWYGVMRGSVAKETFDNHQLQRFPAVCFLKHENNQLSSEMTAFRDAAFWSGPCLTVPSPQARDDVADAKKINEVTALCVAASGVKVVCIRLNAEAPGKVLHTWTTSTKLQRVWSAPAGCLNIILYASFPKHDMQSLFVTAPSSAFDAAHMPGLQLRAGEIALDVQYQPWHASFDKLQAQRLEQGAPKAVCQLLGVLTTQRVLIIARDRRGLTITNSYTYFLPPQRRHYSNRGSASLREAVTSLQWIGMCLAYSTEVGAVEFLPVAAIPRPRALQEHNTLLMQKRSLGMGAVSSRCRLCTLPRGIFNGSSAVVLAILPDRLVYAAVASSAQKGTTGWFIASRPCVPVEPLLSGLLAIKDSLPLLDSFSTGGITLTPPSSPTRLSNKTSSPVPKVNPANAAALAAWHSRVGGILSYCDQAIYSLALTYFPERATGGQDDTANGASPSTHSSRSLCLALLERPVADPCRSLAALVAGIPAAADAVIGDFPPTRWLPPVFKLDIALAAGLHARGVLELLGTRGELQEALLDSSAYIDLPCPYSATSLQLRAAARALQYAGYVLAAAQVADLAGDESFLVSAVLASGMQAKAGAYINELQSSARISAQLPLALHERANDKCKVYSVTTSLSVLALGGNERRDRTFDFSDMLQNAAPSRNLFMGLERRGIVSAAQRALAGGSSGSGICPTTQLGSVAMDILEEFVTPRVKLDIRAPVKAGGGGGLAGLLWAGNGGAEAEVAAAVSTLPDGSPLPSSWMDAIGEGRECDKLCLYCRFSDMSHEGDPTFRNLGAPGARAVFLDLSRYEGHLEVFAKNASDLQVEISSSPVDPGDTHERTKVLCDVKVCASATTKTKQHGLRARVLRGTQLDTGMYHSNGSRTKLTVELTVCFSGSALPAHSCLMRREEGAATAGNADVLWSLSIDSSGHLVWASGANEVRSQKPIPDLLPVAGPDVPPGACGAWVHIAAVLDCSGDPLGGSGSVLLLVNGEKVAKSKGSVPFSPRTEKQLSETTMYICPDLAPGWYYTELRCWADARTAIELERHKDAMLSMGSKRKRLQLRIRGGKKLFSPLDEASWVLKEEAQQIIEVLSSEEEKEAADTVALNDAGDDAAAGAGAPRAGLMASPSLRRPTGIPGTLASPGGLGGPRSSTSAAGAGAGTGTLAGPAHAPALRRPPIGMPGSLAPPSGLAAPPGALRRPTGMPGSLAPPGGLAAPRSSTLFGAGSIDFGSKAVPTGLLGKPRDTGNETKEQSS